MIEKEILEGNKLIAEFMGARSYESNNYFMDYGLQKNSPKNMKGQTIIHMSDILYHSSWDWLMPVLNKCYKLQKDEHTGINTSIKSNCLQYVLSPGDFMCDGAIEIVWEIMVHYIKWYNKNK